MPTRRGRSLTRPLGLVVLWSFMSASWTMVALPISRHSVAMLLFSGVFSAYFVSCSIGAAIAVRAALDGVRVNVGADGAITHVDSWFMTIDSCRLVDGWWRAPNPGLEETSAQVCLKNRERYAVEHVGHVRCYKRAAAILSNLATAPRGTRLWPSVAPPRVGGVFSIPRGKPPW